jgi:hypothetical protein
MLEENYKNISLKKYTRTPRKLLITGWGKSKYIRLKNLTVYFLLIKILLAEENSIEEKNFKLDI